MSAEHDFDMWDRAVREDEIDSARTTLLSDDRKALKKAKENLETLGLSYTAELIEEVLQNINDLEVE